jgi:hypothetical protein
MKRCVIIVVLALFIPAIAQAGTYNNKAYNMSFSYPGGWKLQEMKMPTAAGMAGRTAAQSSAQRFGGIQVARPEGFVSGGEIASQAIDAGIGTAQDTAVAGVSGAVVESMIKKQMPKFASVTLTNSAKPDAQIMFTGVESAAGGGAPSGGYAQSGGRGAKSECKVLEQRKTKWAGRSTQVMTTKCPQDGEWQYTMVANMKKGGSTFSLMGMMAAKSDAEFNKYVKGAFDQIISSTKFN